MASWMYLMLTLWVEKGSNESPTDLQFLSIFHLTRAKLPKSWLLWRVWVHCMWNVRCSLWQFCSGAEHRSSPVNAELLCLELRNRTQRSNVVPAVSSELISLAERQDRFCLGRLHRQSCRRAWYLSQFIWSNTEVLSVLRKLYWLKWCQITLFIRSVVSMTYAEGCI